MLRKEKFSYHRAIFSLDYALNCIKQGPICCVHNEEKQIKCNEK